MSLCTPVLDYGDVFSAFQTQSGQPYSHLAEAYVMYVPRDSHLVRHLLTYWPCFNYWSYRVKTNDTFHSLLQHILASSFFLKSNEIKPVFLCIICPEPVGIEFECEVWTFSCPVLVPAHKPRVFQDYQITSKSWVDFWNNNKQLSS